MTSHVESHVPTSESTPSNDVINSYHINKKFVSQVNQVHLGTVQARIASSDGSMLSVRAIPDPGLQISAISQQLVEKLDLKVNPANISISGIGQTNAQPLGSVYCNLYPRTGSKSLEVHAVVLPNNLITNKISIINIKRIL